jgi:Caspase domain/TPR repeat/Tetratricopeptide repeat
LHAVRNGGPSASGATVRYVLVLLAGSIAWAVPAFAESDGDRLDCASGEVSRIIAGCSAIIAARNPLHEDNLKRATAFNNLGNAYDKIGDHERAIADYSEAIRLNPRYDSAYRNRGKAYHAKHEYDLAIADFDKAISLKPEALAYTNRGLAYAAKGDRERAISDFRAALATTSGDPSDKSVYDTAKQKLAELETKRPVSWDDFPLVVEAPKPENMPTFPLVGEAPKPENTPTTNVLVQPQLPLDQGKRIALVIGNSQYRNIPRLDNPMSDAELMANALKSLGFKLVGDAAQLDLDKSAFDNAVQRFGNDLQGADVGLFYYAGHGVQVRGTNYLIPVNANPTREADADFQMLDAELVLKQMVGAGTKLNVVMLDACRNNPFGVQGLRSSSAGLAQMQAPEGTLISYATQPGSVAQDGTDGNSPYTKALAEIIRRPGLDVFQTFNQVGLAVKKATDGLQQPWVSISPIEGDFYFAGK